MKHLVISLMIAAFVPASATIALAADQKGGPCKADRLKFCADAKPGGGGVRDCLNQHKDELSDACKTMLAHPAKKGGGAAAPTGGAAAPSGGAAAPAGGDAPKAQ